MTIRALRILPPLAIARLGASPRPLENYNVLISDEDPLGFRRIEGAPTLDVDRKSGAIRRVYTPKAVRFKEKNRVKPVAPFLEVWADVDGTLVPLTTALLKREKVRVEDVEWRAHVGNQKAWRRTRDPEDRIDAEVDWFNNHAPHRLLGRCRNFLKGKTLPFGDVQFIRPNGKFPEIRLRYTPGKGVIYGSTGVRNRPEDVAAVVYNANSGTWDAHTDERLDPWTLVTNPGYIYANLREISRGYLDDECDGIVEVRIAKLNLGAFARIGAGPPDYAPDSFPVRTIADELEQILLGPEVDKDDVSPEWTEEIVRRAFETLRLQNTVELNGNPEGANSMASHDADEDGYGRAQEPIMARAIVDTIALRALHQSVFAALRSGMAPWFTQVLRKFDQVGDLSNEGRRKMPAMMRGSDGLHLALTRRQFNAVEGSGNRKANATDASAVVFSTPAPPGEETE